MRLKAPHEGWVSLRCLGPDPAAPAVAETAAAPPEATTAPFAAASAFPPLPPFPEAPSRAAPRFDDGVIVAPSDRQVARSRVGSRLPGSIEGVEALSASVVCVRGANPSYETGPGTNTFLVGAGRERVLIDTADGNDTWRRRLARVCDAEDLSISRVLLTHSHWDHAGGLDWVRATWPRCAALPASLRDGEVCALGRGAALRGVATPGHCNDHVSYQLLAPTRDGNDDDDGALFTGDLVLGEGTVLVLAPPAGSMDDYLASLLRVRDLRPSSIHPGHGHSLVGRGLCCAYAEEYVRVRLERERQILGCLSAGADTADGVVNMIYGHRPGFTAEMRTAATWTTTASLLRLARLGACARQGRRWRPT